MLAGALLLVMGALTIVSAVRGPGMGNTGWQVHLTARINHVASQVEHQLAVLPGRLASVAVLALAGGLAVAARRTARVEDDRPPVPPDRPSSTHATGTEPQLPPDPAPARKALR